LKIIEYLLAVTLGVFLLVSENAMATALAVDCATSPYDASQGNIEPALMLISVTDPNGGAVTGLDTRNFDIALYAIDTGGTTSVASIVESANEPGFYKVYIRPTYEATGWGKANYLIGVTVTNGSDRGSTATNLMIED
jgi:hypothetical protein